MGGNRCSHSYSQPLQVFKRSIRCSHSVYALKASHCVNSWPKEVFTRVNSCWKRCSHGSCEQCVNVNKGPLAPPLSRCFGRLPARPCIMPSWHSHPENHEAICSDPVERLAPMSQHEVETAYQVAQEGSEAFPVICGPAATSFWHDQQTRCGVFPPLLMKINQPFHHSVLNLHIVASRPPLVPVCAACSTHTPLAPWECCRARPPAVLLALSDASVTHRRH